MLQLPRTEPFLQPAAGSAAMRWDPSDAPSGGFDGRIKGCACLSPQGEFAQTPPGGPGRRAARRAAEAGRVFLPSSLPRSKEEGRPPGRNPGQRYAKPAPPVTEATTAPSTAKPKPVRYADWPWDEEAANSPSNPRPRPQNHTSGKTPRPAAAATDEKKARAAAAKWCAANYPAEWQRPGSPVRTTRGPHGGRHTLRLEVASRAGLRGAPNELDSAVRNLLTNAVRYTPEGGTITVGWRVIDGEGALWVRDTGIGVAAEHLSRLTERFYRVDRGRSRETGGTGLGLAIVKHVLMQHGGRLQVQSVPGQGSTFAAVFPASRVQGGG